MQFTELIEQQKRLHKSINKWPEDLEQIAFHVVAAVGEIAHELLPTVSWERTAKTTDQQKLITAFAEVFYYLLVYYAWNDDGGILEPDEITWAESIWCNWAEEKIEDRGVWIGYFLKISKNIYLWQPYESLMALAALANENGISRDEIETAYLKRMQSEYKNY